MKLEQFREEIKYRNIYNFVMDKTNDYFFDVDLEYIGEGASRRVYRYNNMAIKIAKNNFGLLQNEAEVEIFNKCKDTELINIICPILWHDSENKVVICKYAKPYYATKYQNEGYRDIVNILKVRHEEELPMYNLLKKFRKMFKMTGSTAINDTLKESAWGNLDNRPVLVDYGYNDDVASRYGWGGLQLEPHSFDKLTGKQLYIELEERVKNNFKTKKQIKAEREAKSRAEFREPMGIQGFQDLMLDIIEMDFFRPKLFEDRVFKIGNAL